MFDKTIDPFDEPARAEDYINLQDLQRQGKRSLKLYVPISALKASLLHI